MANLMANFTANFTTHLSADLDLFTVTLAAAAAGLGAAALVWLAGGLVGRVLVRRRADQTNMADLVDQTHLADPMPAAPRASLGAQFDEVLLFARPRRLWALGAALAALVAASVAGLGANAPWTLAAAAAALILPHGWSRRWRRTRLARFDAQLPDTLAALAAALRAGAALPSALRVIVAESEAPLAQEFGVLLRQQRLGVAFGEALASLHARVPTAALGLVVAVLRVSAQTGGNLADTLERVAATLRAREHLRRRVRALTAQGRMQAWVLASLPPLLALALDFLEPEAMSALWHTPLGWLTLTVVVVLEALGVYLIRRIVAIEV